MASRKYSREAESRHRNRWNEGAERERSTPKYGGTIGTKKARRSATCSTDKASASGKNPDNWNKEQEYYLETLQVVQRGFMYIYVHIIPMWEPYMEKTVARSTTTSHHARKRPREKTHPSHQKTRRHKPQTDKPRKLRNTRQTHPPTRRQARLHRSQSPRQETTTTARTMASTPPTTRPPGLRPRQPRPHRKNPR